MFVRSCCICHFRPLPVRQSPWFAIVRGAKVKIGQPKCCRKSDHVIQFVRTIFLCNWMPTIHLTASFPRVWKDCNNSSMYTGHRCLQLPASLSAEKDLNNFANRYLRYQTANPANSVQLPKVTKYDQGVLAPVTNKTTEFLANLGPESSCSICMCMLCLLTRTYDHHGRILTCYVTITHQPPDASTETALSNDPNWLSPSLPGTGAGLSHWANWGVLNSYVREGNEMHVSNICTTRNEIWKIQIIVFIYIYISFT